MAKQIGRPTKYKKLYAEIALTACANGCSDKELSHLLGVSKSTINRWKHDHEDFWDSLREGKIIACIKVVKALFMLAVGYETTETTSYFDQQKKLVKQVTITKSIPPNVRAIELWLKVKSRNY